MRENGKQDYNIVYNMRGPEEIIFTTPPVFLGFPRHSTPV